MEKLLPSNKILTVYYGPPPPWFSLWVESCAWNPNFNWVLIGDAFPDIKYPKNIEHYPLAFEAFRKLIEKKTGIKPALHKPYKVCDYRPAFGEIFAEIINESDFWGYCDIDTLWGKLEDHLPAPIWAEHDKILKRGHLAFFRNTARVNRAYRLEYSGANYRKVFANPESFIFDETPGINQLMKENGFRIHEKEILADIHPEVDRFKLTQHRNFKHQAFAWKNGEIHHYYYEAGSNELKKRSFAYIHFQKRKFSCKLQKLPSAGIAVTPKGFQTLPDRTLRHHDLTRLNRPRYFHFSEKKISEWRIKLGGLRRKFMTSAKTENSSL